MSCRVRSARVLVGAALATGLLVAGCSSTTNTHPGTRSPAGPTITSRPAVPTTSAAPSTPITTAESSSTSPTTPAAPSSPRSTHRSTTPAAHGRVVVLNPGHNGGNESHTSEINRQVPAGYGDRKACDTTGTETDAGYPEHAFTWDLAKRIRAVLEHDGLRVVMTRHNDHSVGPCVDKRAEIGNKPDVAAVVTLHADGGPADGRGFHVNQASKRPDGATAKVAHESDQLGQAIHKTLVNSSGLVPSTYIGDNGYVYRSDFAGLNLATRPATFLELGNMRNSGDAAKLSSPAGRQRIAVAVADGITAYVAKH